MRLYIKSLRKKRFALKSGKAFYYLLRFFVYKYSEKRKAGVEEHFICFTIILTELCSFTSAASAHRIYPAVFTPFGNYKTFLNKLNGNFTFFHLRKVCFKNVSQIIFIGTIKITGIDISVCFTDKLMGAVTFYSALLRRLTEIEPYPVIELTDAYIFMADIVLDIKIKDLYEKIPVLLGCHIKLTFFG